MQSESPSKTPLQAVIFDLDGLMFNTEELYQEFGRRTLASLLKSLTQDLLDHMTGRKSDLPLQIMFDRCLLHLTVEAVAD